MNEILANIIVVIMAIIGGATALFFVLSIPCVLGWKIYRHFKYGYKITD